MTFLSNYQKCIQAKTQCLKDLMIEDNSVTPEWGLDFKTLNTSEGINQAYEFFTMSFDKRIGINTTVGQTKLGPVFIRHQTKEGVGNLTQGSLAYRHELYAIKALHKLKVAFDFINIFVKDKEEGLRLKEEIYENFLKTLIFLKKNDGSANITTIGEDFEKHISTLMHKKSEGPVYKKQKQMLATWAGTDFPPHDIITIDDLDKTFEIIASLSSPHLTLFVEMMSITYFKVHQTIPSPSELFIFIKKQQALSEDRDAPRISLEEVQSVYDSKDRDFLSWYLTLDPASKKIIEYYSKGLTHNFISCPVLLHEHAHQDKHSIFPTTLRAFHANLNGWIHTSDIEKQIKISGISFRSGAASRIGNQDITNINIGLIFAAVDAFKKEANLCSAALLTDAITYVSSLKTIVGGKREPDKKILDAHVQSQLQHPDRMKLKISSIIMHSLSKYLGRHIQHDPFELLNIFKSSIFDQNNPFFQSLNENKSGTLLLSAYQAVQWFVREYDQNVGKGDFYQFIKRAKIKNKRVMKTLYELKKCYLETEDTNLLKHIRLLESLQTYMVIRLNFMKKEIFGKHLQPVIETVIEHAVPNPRYKMGHQQYEQWMLALENIIGENISALNEASPTTSDNIHDVITHIYCKDGRDRTGLIAILFKVLHKMFDLQVSTRINHDVESVETEILPFSMIPMTSLEMATPLFKETHDRVVYDASSALLCGSPQSALADYGLLDKLFGAAHGLVSTSVPPIRTELHRVTLPIATGFEKFYRHHTHSLHLFFKRATGSTSADRTLTTQMHLTERTTLSDT
jgi:hypothetical protein